MESHRASVGHPVKTCLAEDRRCEADNLGNAVVEAFARFHQAHPRMPIFGRNVGLSKRVEVSET